MSNAYGMPGFDFYNNDYAKLQQQFDLYNSQTTAGEVLAPHPDLFESELDSSLAGIDPLTLELLTVNNSDAFTLLRSETPTCGPPSTLTVSSESASAYDSLSSYSESFYSSTSPYSTSNYSFPLDSLDMDFQRIDVTATSDYGAGSQLGLLDSVDPSTFGALPPTPPRSPPSHGQNNGKVYNGRSSFSDYGPATRSVLPSGFYNSLDYATSINPAAVSPTHITTQLPITPSSIPLAQPTDEVKSDPRKKYKCNICPRAFARAYNLKTHMATHDPNRLKPHVCPHRSCGRSFSRKHDLGRHLISIHRDESVCSSHHSASSKKSIGVEKGQRTWCESCGKSWVGRNTECDCNDVK
ncbi:hypothetical protein Moror_257 [Moniliophthora roreri MCA 2997]|uniref:C2H2-type domain-containing protein n=1 Tax=Moniliophthora roreri (strain MCA 2997) TaxID=1381753 RepID=V2XXL1_MONRO|nr:hypothetical protein Moror_257 [Moniliophthora roreri MCA 2997]